MKLWSILIIMFANKSMFSWYKMNESLMLLVWIHRLGFPLMIKAVKGGGGKGMRIARNAEEFLSQAQSCQSEAEKAFGDGALLIERWTEQCIWRNAQRVSSLLLAFPDKKGKCQTEWNNLLRIDGIYH
jgi:pyruvate carboxylase